MHIRELKTKPTKELERLLSERRDKLRELRFKDTNKQLKNVKEIKKIKQTIARVLTVLKANKEVSKQQESVKL